MLFTSLAAAAAVSGLTTGFTPTAQPKWQPDYPTAARLAAAQHKPLAVFVGHGQAGFAQSAPAGEAAKTLGEKFVSVYIDADSAAGKPLADALKVTDGLVISDHTGTVQALRHQGAVQPAVLSGYLTAFAVEQPVVQTVQAGTLVRADTPAPVAAPAPVYAPAPAVYPNGGFGGGCAGGSCGGGYAPVMSGGCSGGSCGGGRMGLFR